MSVDHTLNGQASAVSAQGATRATAGAGLVFAVFVGVAALFTAIDLSGARLALGDFDDIVRHVQVRGLMEGQDWFDMRLGVLAMPEAVQSHYARIVDFPYVMLGRLFALFVPLDTAQHMAELVWPPAMLLLFAWFFTRAMTAIHDFALDRRHALLAAMLAVMALFEFSPGRIDHHNVQLVLMAAMMAGIVSPRASGGLLAGVAVSLSVGVGLEGLPYIVTAFGALALAAAWKPEALAGKVSLAGLAMAVTALPAAIAAYGPVLALETRCDAASAPYVAALAGGGLVMAAAALAWRKTVTGTGWPAMAARLAILGLPALGVLAGVAFVWPECLRGHYNMLDPLVRQLWLEPILQEKPVFSQLSDKFVTIAFLCSAGFVVLAASFPLALRRLREGRTEVAIVWATALVSLLVYIALERASRFTGLFVPLLAPALLASLQAAFPRGVAPDRAARLRLATGAGLSLLFIGALAVTVLPNRTKATVLDQIMTDTCTGASLAAFDGAPPGRVMSPIGVSMRIIAERPDFQVASLALHRASPGIRRMFDTLAADDPATLGAVLQPFDYVAVCERDYQVSGMEDFALLDRLVRHRPVAGLVPVGDAAASDLRLYRIDHAALR